MKDITVAQAEKLVFGAELLNTFYLEDQLEYDTLLGAIFLDIPFAETRKKRVRDKCKAASDWGYKHYNFAEHLGKQVVEGKSGFDTLIDVSKLPAPTLKEAPFRIFAQVTTLLPEIQGMPASKTARMWELIAYYLQLEGTSGESPYLEYLAYVLWITKGMQELEPTLRELAKPMPNVPKSDYYARWKWQAHVRDLAGSAVTYSQARELDVWNTPTLAVLRELQARKDQLREQIVNREKAKVKA